MIPSLKPARATIDERWHRLGWSVVGVKLRVARNRFAQTRRRNPIRTITQFAIIVPLILLVTTVLAIGFGHAVNGIEDQGLITTLLASLIAIVVLGAFIGSSTTALQALYLSDDVPFLLTLPIPLRALFGGKFVEAFAGTLPTATLFTAMMFGYGWVRSASKLFWIIGPVVGLSIALIATAVSVIVVSTVTRYIPPKRARLFLLAISLFLVMMTMAAWQLLAPRPGAFSNAVSREEYEPLWNALAWTPGGWGAEAMASAASGDLLRALGFTSAVVAACAGSIIISFHVFRHAFVRGLARTRSVQTNAPSASLTRWLSYLAELLPARMRAGILKEWLVLFRDLRRLSGAIWPVGIVLVYTVLLSRGSGSDFGTRELDFWSRNGSLALLPWGLSLGISVYAYGSEGRNVHLLRMLPYSAARVFAIKVIASLLPVGVISLGASALSLWLRSAPFNTSVQLLALIAWMVTGFVIIDTAAGAVAPNFEADQVQRTIGLPGRFFSFALGGIFVLATIVGAGRLVLMTVEPPDSLASILSADHSGVDTLGWPLVVAATAAALGVVVFAAALAIRETNHLIRAGI